MRISLLGPVEVAVGDHRIPLGATKQRAVLAMLALRANSVVSVDTLVDGLWGEDPPATASKMVQLYVSQLRRVLDGHSAEIVTRGRGYELRIDPGGLDAARFERLVEDGDAQGALALWHGPAMSDVRDEPFAAVEILRLEELRLRALEMSIDADLEAGRGSETIGRLVQMIAEHPLRESLHERRMLALYRSGRQAEALAAYREARRCLVEAAGVEPGVRLRDLHERILRQDPELDAVHSPTPATAVAGVTAGVSRMRAHRSLSLVAIGMAVAGLIFAVSRSAAPDSLPGIDTGAVGVIDPQSAAITAQYEMGGELSALAQGGDSVWVAHRDEGRVSRIRAGRIDTIAIGRAAAGLVFHMGSLWVAGEEDGTVAEVPAAAGRVTRRLLNVGNGLRAIAAGFGSLWVSAGADRDVVRVDPSAGRVTARVPVGGRPGALVVAADAVWAAVEDGSTLVRIDPASDTSTDAVAVGRGPVAVASGAGAVWVANRHDGTVSRVDPRSARVTHTVPVGSEPTSLAVAAGSVWVGDAAATIRRLDPESVDVSDMVRTGSPPASLIELDGSLWAATASPVSAHRGGILRVAEPGPVEPDPALGLDPYSAPLIHLTHDGLLGYRRVGGAAGAQIVPELATSVPVPAEGGRRYAFRLRDGVRFSDGTPVRAGDFRASMERMVSSNPEYAAIYESIRGVTACTPARCDLSGGIRTDDVQGTIELRLRVPDPELLPRLALPAASLVPSRSARPRAGRSAPGTGPYRLRRVVAGRSVVFERNPHFRVRAPLGRPDGFPDRITVRMNATADTQPGSVERGELDLFHPLVMGPDALAAAREQAPSRLRSGPAALTVFAFLNVRRPPFDDVRVRQAVNLAVDRSHLVSLAGGSEVAAATCQILPPGMSGYRPVCPFTRRDTEAGIWVAPDRERAQGLVRDSGTRGRRVSVWTTPDRRAIAVHLAAVLTDLGYRTRLREFRDVAGLYAAAQDRRSRPEIGVLGWNAEHLGAERFLRDLVSCDSEANLSRFCDPAVDRAIRRSEAAGISSGDLLVRLEQRVAAAAPVVPLYNLRFPVVVSERVGNLQFSPLSGVLLDQAWVR